MKTDLDFAASILCRISISSSSGSRFWDSVRPKKEIYLCILYQYPF